MSIALLVLLLPLLSFLLLPSRCCPWLPLLLSLLSILLPLAPCCPWLLLLLLLLHRTWEPPP
jgi:hypothetical protein